MEQALSEVCKDIRIGKILIQNNIETGEPEVNIELSYYLLITLYELKKKMNFSCITFGYLVTLKTI